MVTLSLMVANNLTIDLVVITNIIIASATAMAALIHFDSIRTQRKDRIWEINKKHLLELSKALSDIIDITQKQVDYEFEKMQQIHNNEPTSDNSTEYKAFSKSLNHSLTVYEPMLGDEIPIAIKKFKTKNENINLAYDNGHITSLFEVYDNILVNQVELNKSLSQYIKRIAGTKNI